MMKVIKRKFVTATQQSPLFYLWFIPAWLLLGFTRLVIVTVTFRRFAHWLGMHDGLAPRTPLTTRDQEIRARAISKAITIASKYAPWTANCFPQAITARVILGFYDIPYALFFGVRRSNTGEEGSELKAHAWVVSGRVSVTGGRSFGQFTSVGCFVSN
ncbi:MAG: hypothetical protein ACI9TB_002543 [Parasphingorhabdus sp.]|jgi:hypothetical protein|uniref:lasso peptide biosynthesis B2 protein n=1 Tax=Parasphingorhabdus sp. TaxID=2709688 RepID=UPI001B71FF9F|nr:lasso peptide biosynthesis B2 protein [Parasphingorhabdus sp.]MBQ0771648.1 lasso peptide biosynthesis B2 protein [Sphingomonadales bacterium]